jgi:hypothetical protein
MDPMPDPAAATPPALVNPKTVRLAKGRHEPGGPDLCVMELAALLAGEPHSDYPRCVCPIAAAFLRGYNDNVGDAVRPRLYATAVEVLGSRVDDPAVRRERTARCLEMGRRLHATRRIRAPWGPRYGRHVDALNAEIAGAHAGLAVRLRPELHGAVEDFLAELLGTRRAGRAPACPPPAVRPAAADQGEPALRGAPVAP